MGEGTNRAAVTAEPPPTVGGLQLIEHWRLAWRFWSVRLNALGSLILGALLAWPDFALGIWNVMPVQIGGQLPEQLALMLPLVLFVAAIAARLITQKKLVREVAAREDCAAPKEDGGSFQSRVQPWMTACFGTEISGDREERNHRFFEEAGELVQSLGMTEGEAIQLVRYTWGRPVGYPSQEVGGVRVTLAALCLANGLDDDAAAEAELARIWTKIELIRAKQAAKPKHSPLPQAHAAAPASLTSTDDGDEDQQLAPPAGEKIRSGQMGAREPDSRNPPVFDPGSHPIPSPDARV